MRIILLLLSLSLVLGCRKTKVVSGQKWLPIATEDGRGIFGCYMNDKTFVARQHDAINYNPETGYLFIESSNRHFEFRLFVYEGVFGEGVYEFENTDEEWISSDYSQYFGVNEGGINTLFISRLNIEKKIISGTFNVDLIDDEGNEKLIREGRFDLTLNLIE
jgi:hypothetical protein